MKKFKVDLESQIEKKCKSLGLDHLSYLEIHRSTDISPRVLSSYKTGRATGIQFDKLWRLCEYFDCKPSELLKETSDGTKD